MDKEILFFIISIMLLVIYRMILSIRLLTKKQNIIDEKYYVSFFYVSLVDIVVLIFKNVIVGFILIGLLPILLTLYVALANSRIYWIINGYEITDATFNNQMKTINPEYENINKLIDVVSFEHKRNEKKTKVIISSKKYEEKEKILSIIVSTLKEKINKANKVEIIYLSVCFVLFLILLLLLIIVLFT